MVFVLHTAKRLVFTLGTLTRFVAITSRFLFTILIAVSGCNPCGIEILQKLSGLIDNRELIAYRSNCGATQSYVIHVTFNKPGLNLNSFFFPNDVFASDRGVGLALERISADTVAIHYIALADPYPMVKKLNGIVFIYKSGSEIFSDSLRLLRLRTF